MTASRSDAHTSPLIGLKTLLVHAFLAIVILATSCGWPTVAHAAGESFTALASQTTGTTPFDTDDSAGHDSSPTNSIVRTNDTVSYAFQITTTTSLPGTTITLRLPSGEEAQPLPPYCGTGSSITPSSIGEPKVPITADSYKSLPAQTIVCALGDLPAASAQTFTLMSKVRPEVPNGTTLAAPTATIGSNNGEQVSPTLAANIVSAKAQFDIGFGWQQAENAATVNGPILNDLSRTGTGFTTQVQAGTLGYTISFPVTISAPSGGKGISPLQDGFTATVDLNPETVFGSQITQTTAWKAAGADAATKYRPLVASYGAVGDALGGAMSSGYAPSAGTLNPDSVTTGGNPRYVIDPATGKMTITFTNLDTSAWHTPTKLPNGTLLPDRGYVFSGRITLGIPLQTVQDLGLQSGSAWTLNGKLLISELTGKDLAGNTDVSAPIAVDNNYRAWSMNYRLSGASSTFWAAPPDEPDNSQRPIYDFLPQQTGSYTGDGVAYPGKHAYLMTFSTNTLGGTADTLNGGVIAWDNDRVAFNTQLGPAGSGRVYGQGTAGQGTWISYASLNGTSIVPELQSRMKVQYGYSANLPVETSTDKNRAVIAESTVGWFDDPAAVPGSDPALAEQGIYTGINRIRYTVDMSGYQGDLRYFIEANTVYLGGLPTGSTVPMWQSHLGRSDLSTWAKFEAAATTQFTGSEYWTGPMASDPIRGSFGDRFTTTDILPTLQQHVQDATGAWVKGTPSFTVGQTAAWQTSIGSYPIIPGQIVTQDVTVCVPKGLLFNESSASVKPVSIVTDNPDCYGTLITWRIRNGSDGLYQPITYTTTVRQSAINGTYKVTATTDTTGSPSGLALAQRTSSADLQVNAPVGMRLEKIAVDPEIQQNLTNTRTPDVLEWDISVYNMNSPQGVSNLDVVDLLPVSGALGSSFAGSYTFTSAAVTAGTGIQIWYTTGDAVAAEQDPSSVTWTTTPPAKPTALRFTREGVFTPGDEFTVRVTLTPVGNQAGDVYDNQASLRSDGIQGVVGPVNSQITVVGSTIGDLVWHDANRNGIHDAGERGLDKVNVILTGTGTRGETITRTTTTDQNGNYAFSGLVSGTYFVTLTGVDDLTPAPYQQGTDEAVDSNLYPDYTSTTITVTEGETYTHLDLGLDGEYITAPLPLTGAGISWTAVILTLLTLAAFIWRYTHPRKEHTQ